MQTTSDERWDTFAATGVAGGVLWRRHSDSVNRALVERWFPRAPLARVLKTDLYDEAAEEGVAPALAERAGTVVGIDLAGAVIDAARRRHPWLETACADVRRLPFEDGAFDAVLSVSTLDHFAAEAEIEAALRELHRVVAPGGAVVLTLDNVANPIVALRNALPLRLLRRPGLVPYPVGVSCGPRRLRALLERSGFAVDDMSATLHCPRVAAVRAADAVHRRGGPEAQRRFLRFLSGWETLGRLPTRYLTGHFVAAGARRLP